MKNNRIENTQIVCPKHPRAVAPACTDHRHIVKRKRKLGFSFVTLTVDVTFTTAIDILSTTGETF